MASADNNPTQRFSSRVENYVKFRPSYPSAVIDLLKAECGLSSSATVADIGSGTGIFTRLLLESGATIYAVEPNREMREAAEAALGTEPNFKSVAATAEQTGLPDGSIDLVTAAQAFHWFNVSPTRAEFKRILKPGGQVALIWNDRHTNTTPFLREYEKALLAYGTDYQAVVHRNVERKDHEVFFAPTGYKLATFPNIQVFGWGGFWGRVMSSSYVPEAGHPNHEPLLNELKRIFEEYNVDGHVSFEYTTEVYYGALA